MVNNNRASIADQILHTLIDERPITSILVVEDPKRCPPHFKAIERTFDKDQEADLWRETGFLWKRTTRFLCVSRTPSENGLDSVIDRILLINDKEVPPIGFSVIYRTSDSDQKAWRRKQLCFRLSKVDATEKALTDVIVCNHEKSDFAAVGFSYLGPINGVHLYYKMGSAQSSTSNDAVSGSRNTATGTTNNPESVPGLYPTVTQSEAGGSYPPAMPVVPGVPFPSSIGYSWNGRGGSGADVPRTISRTNTLGSHASALDGVKLDLSPEVKQLAMKQTVSMPKVKLRTMEDLDREYQYDCKLENEVLTQYTN